MSQICFSLNGKPFFLNREFPRYHWEFSTRATALNPHIQSKQDTLGKIKKFRIYIIKTNFEILKSIFINVFTVKLIF